MDITAKVLVVDTGAFVNKLPLWEHGEVLVSVHEVLNEIKDTHTKDFVEAFPAPVDYRQPQPASIKFMNDFTKKTGDYHALSLTDIKLLALTYELEVDANGKDHLRTEPMKVITNTHISVPVEELKQLDESEQSTDSNMETTGSNSNDENADDDDEGWSFVGSRKTAPAAGAASVMNTSIVDDTVSMASTVKRKRDAMAKNMLPGFFLPRDDDDEHKLEEDDEDNDDSDDGGGWITPDNINQLLQGEDRHSSTDAGDICFFEENEQPQAPAVACITADFAMQNVLRHIGLFVKGLDGKLIKNVRNYVLRCFTCFKVTPDMNKLFCPKCGHRTLKRVSMTIDADGSQRIWISRRPLNTRGLKFNLPKPRGGQHAVMPLLTADQRFPQQWAKRSKNTNALSEDFVAGSSPFSTRDVYSRAAQHGYVSGNNVGIKGQLKHAKIWRPKKGKNLKK